MCQIKAEEGFESVESVWSDSLIGNQARGTIVAGTSTRLSRITPKAGKLLEPGKTKKP